MGDNLIGQVLGNYRLKKKLGEGGFAEVYLAENIHIRGMFVAIKIARDTLPEEKKEQFRKEATTISQLRHAHIIRLLDFGLHNNLPYLVMDYVEHGSLRIRLSEGPKLELSKIVKYIKQIADALQYAHNHDPLHRLVHRDVKPENILCLDDNNVLLSDFGIAITSNITNYTVDSQDKQGTLPYMAPEHIRGKARSASDQYSLGIMVYELLCGELPFNGEVLQLMYQHFEEPPPPLHDKIAILPAFEAVVMKALAKDPTQRYASVTEFAQALEEASKFPDESYYLPHVAQAMRECYLRSKKNANNLGVPLNISQTEEVKVKSRRGTEGYQWLFTKGAIYWCERGAFSIFLGFDYIHKASGGVEGLLGFPLSEDDPAAPSPQGSTGSFQRFEGEEDYPEDVNTPPVRCGATTYWRRGGRSVVVMGKIGECYERLHGTAGFLGFPISKEENIGPFQLGSKGRYQKFEGGSIYWKEGSSQAFPIGKDIEKLYHSDNGVQSRLGFPMSSESDTVASPQGTLGKYQRFEGGLHDGWPTANGSDHSKGVRVYWSKKYGAYPVLGGLGVCYERLGGVNSLLGFPIEGEVEDGTGRDRWYQNFEGGAIYWCKEYEGVPVIGAIFDTYKAHGGCGGRFGFPKAQQTTLAGQPDGSFIQVFEGGLISVYPERAAIARKWDMHDVPGIVDQIYRQVLRRPVEPGGLITYGAQLNRGEKSVRDIVKVIGRSPEFKEKFLDTKPDDEKIDECFEHFLGRGADWAKKSTYVEMVKERGFDRERDKVINALVSSEEYELAFGSDYAPIVTSGLSVVSQVPGKVDCFYGGRNGHLYRRQGTMPSWESTIITSNSKSVPTIPYEQAIVRWDNEEADEGGYLTSVPAAVSWGPLHLECFYRGGDNRLWHRWWYEGSSGHEGCIGGYLTSAPTVVSRAEYSIDCFYRGTNYQLFYCRKDAKSQTWIQEEDLGGFLTSAPAVVSWGPEHLECFYRGPDGGLRHRWKYDDGDWSYEDNLGGCLASAPSVIATQKNHLDCFYRGLNSHLLRRHWDGDKRKWLEEEDLGGILASAPAAIAPGGDYIDCYYRGQDRCLWHRWWDGEHWSAEECIGGILI